VKEEFKRQLCLELVLRRYRGVIAVWLRQRSKQWNGKGKFALRIEALSPALIIWWQDLLPINVSGCFLAF
jgi:hypothetical protein